MRGAGLWPATTTFEPACLGFPKTCRHDWRHVRPEARSTRPCVRVRSDCSYLLGNRCDPHFHVVHSLVFPLTGPQPDLCYHRKKVNWREPMPSETILVVDDDAAVLEYCRAVLAQ